MPTFDPRSEGVAPPAAVTRLAGRADQIFLARAALLLLLVGLAWRAFRYLLRFPIWGDEAMVALNFVELGYTDLLRELRYCQVAPLLFVWGELTALKLLGSGELAMRLLPFLAGTVGLVLFWRLARECLAPLAATFAVGFLAVAMWPVSMCTFIKPYSFDLLAAVLLLDPAARWLRDPARPLTHPACRAGRLCAVAPLAVFLSFPAAFVGGGVLLALTVPAWRQGWASRCWLAGFGAVLVGSFLAHFAITGRGQLGTPVGGVNTDVGMRAYWAEGFPPAEPLKFVPWFLRAHTGQMAAYPVGAQDGGSALTALLALIGGVVLWAERRRALLLLCMAPFALWFVAAVLHKYPYGASGRLSQHVAPAYCLLAGLGLAWLVERARNPATRRRWVVGLVALLLCVGVGGMVRDGLRPYREMEAVWTRQVMRDLTARAEGAPLLVMNPQEEVCPVFRWYLELLGDQVMWGGELDRERADRRGELNLLRYRLGPPESPAPTAPKRTPLGGPTAEVEAVLARLGPGWALETADTEVGVPLSGKDPVKLLDCYRLVRCGSAPLQGGGASRVCRP